ncbi:USP9X hydrolase, partial [Polypterus senegalus]
MPCIKLIKFQKMKRGDNMVVMRAENLVAVEWHLGKRDRDTQKIQWIDRFIEELRTNDKWVIPALKQIREICSLFGEAPQNLSQTQRSPHVFYRHDLINQLQHNHALVTLVAENLSAYMESMRQFAKDHTDYDPQTVRVGSRYSHVQEVQERLNFLRFLLKDGQLWLCAPQAKQIWKCLAENAVFLCDREACFKWYSKLMGDEPDLDPDINKDFFENNVLQLDPSLLTENGMKCFERFFKAVNCREGKLVAKRRAYMMDDLELIGLDYLWRVVIQGSDDIAGRAIDLLKEIYTNLGPKLQVNQVEIHEDFIQSCFDRLKASYDTLCVLDGDKDSINCARQEAIRMVRVLTVLREYINECDSDYHEERTILPMSRAFRGKHITLIVRFPNQGRQVDDLDIWSHTNDTIGSVRRCILNRIKANSTHTKIELFIGGELVDPADDRKLIGQLNLKDKTIMSLHLRYISFLWQVADLGCSLNMPLLRDGARVLMKLMPPDNTTVEKLRANCLDHAKLGENSLSPTLDSLFFGPSPSQVLYLTEVVYALLMPASGTLGEDASDFQYNFLKSGGLPLVLSMLTRNNFLPNADMETRRGAYLNALKIAKLLLTAVGFGHVKAVAEACQPIVEGTSPVSPINQATHDQALVLQNALQNIPNPSSECMLRNVAIRLAQQISDEVGVVSSQLGGVQNFFQASKYIPDICVIRAVQKIVWASGCGTVQLVFSSNDEISKIYEKSTARERAKHAGDYFTLLRHLLNYAYNSNINLPNAEVLLNNEIDWLKRIRDEVKRTGETGVEETILEGHVGVTKELLAFQTTEKKYYIGCEKGGANLIKELIDDFIFPASNVYLQYMKSGEFPAEQAIPVCSTPATINAGFELLVALAVGCVRNLKQIVDTLTDMYYLGCEALTEWEYLPPVGPRPPKGFVGLKNAGATCYMNSVIQQLYMIPPIRNGILAIEGTGSDVDDDMSGDEKQDNETNVDPRDEVFSYHHQYEEKPCLSKTEDRKEYNIGVLRHLQVIFGHLAASRLQYYVPRGFWKQFRLWGEPVNLREQHDALEFFNSLVDSLDEALKALGHPAMLSKVLGGSFADQKICQGCPHRYECEESFTTLNVDIRNHQNLLDSMEQYVKGDLLEGANAYHCEKCNKKVDTVKRLLIKKLPPVLAIQLKRFDYDWERECAIKFNDYFEFPRELDMEPYTVAGVAKLEGDDVNPENQIIQNEPSENEQPRSTKYRLVGVLVHSGQASGGHYYSYIIQRNGGDGEKNRWYKFDDGDVTECKMDDEEEMKNQCFGGEYMGEVFDHMMKRMSYRRQKRWWNAYILFYERMDTLDKDNELLKYIAELTITTKPHQIKMPSAIERSVRKQNVQFMHNRMQYDALCILLRHSKNVRYWFAHNVLFAYQNRFSEYLLECPSAEVRGAFSKLIVFIAHFSLQDGPCSSPFGSPGPSTQACDNLSLSDHLLRAVLNLLRREVSEHGRHLQQYFNLFVMYANLGVAEKTQLLKLSVPATFMLVALDEGPGPPIKYQYAELGKLYTVVSQLVRCCDVSSRMQSSINGNPPLPNPYGDPNLSQPIMPLQQLVAEILFVRTSYVKKIIEDCSNSEETIKLLRFSCWENPQFSSTVLSELLWQVAYSYTYELRPYLDLLLQILLIEDSWQTHRIHNVLKGIPDDRDGLFDTIQRSKNHYQKRAYQCIKCMVALFSNCSVAYQILQSNGDLKRKWTWAVEWLGDELERRPYTGNPQYTYNNWSPPVQSNETSNGYFLERSHSARMTLAKACELCPEEEPDDQEAPDDHDSSPPEDASLYPHSPSTQYQQTSSPTGLDETSSANSAVDQSQGVGTTTSEDDEPAFPHAELAKLDDLINRPCWVVPVLPKGELEVILEAAIDLSKKGLDVKCEACQSFFREGLTVSFRKLLTDDAVSGWKFEIHGWLVDLINRFGTLNGFQILHDRIMSGHALNVQIIAALIRLLQISSFNGKMNALNEVNKVIASISYSAHHHGNAEEVEEWLTAERMAEWIQQNNILSILLRDSLHQLQYVEKLEKILRFVIKEKALTLGDLDNIWTAQESWTNASKKQREKLLELIRYLAEDDKDGVMAHKVLNLLWNLAHSENVPIDIMDQALSAHIKILDYSCSQDQDTQKIQWIERFIEVLHSNDKWVIPALKQIREICSLFGESPSVLSQAQRSPHVFYRHDLINQLQHTHALITLVTENLSTYMESMKQFVKVHSGYDPQTVREGRRYSHVQEVQERLNFLRFLLKDGQLWLCAPQAKKIWKCLAENAVFICDREACFKWYSKLMRDEPDLEPDINKDFFENNVLQLDPSLLTENGMKCFERFFKTVNFREGKLVAKRRVYLMDDLELIGLDYLWQLVTAKLVHVSSAMPSSLDSSSDSSVGSTGNNGYRYSDSPSPDAECCLLGVIMSLHQQYIIFLWQVSDLGCSLKMPLLRDGARVLMKLMPPDETTVAELRANCLNHAKHGKKHLSPTLDSLFFGPSQSQVLYLTEVVYALFMPASGILGDDASDFQYNFLKSGGLTLVLNMLTRNNFIPSADMETRRGAYLNVLKIAKLLLTAVGFAYVKAVAEAWHSVVEGAHSVSQVSQAAHDQALVLQNALQNIPNPFSENMLRKVAIQLAQQISCEPGIISSQLGGIQNFFVASSYIPDIYVIRAIQKIVWASGCGTVQLVFSSNDEINKVYEKDEVKRTGATGVEETILEGHMGLTKELLDFQTIEKKICIGCVNGGINLIKELIDDFIFPASNLYLQWKKGCKFPTEQAIAVCSSPATINAGFELLVALAVGCVQNLKQIADAITDMYYSGGEKLTEWEYLPTIGPRTLKGFVGLKNAGATCYMNSVIQQLYMIPAIRNGILAVEAPFCAREYETSGDEKQEHEGKGDLHEERKVHQYKEKSFMSKTEDRKAYNIGLLQQLQVIFGHLAASRLQYYVPIGFWKQFRLWGEPVNLREQHDALEFFNSLVDSLDEALKALGHPPMLSKVLGGSFADQKICQGCPHSQSGEPDFVDTPVLQRTVFTRAWGLSEVCVELNGSTCCQQLCCLGLLLSDFFKYSVQTAASAGLGLEEQFSRRFCSFCQTPLCLSSGHHLQLLL